MKTLPARALDKEKRYLVHTDFHGVLQYYKFFKGEKLFEIDKSADGTACCCHSYTASQYAGWARLDHFEIRNESGKVVYFGRKALSFTSTQGRARQLIENYRICLAVLDT